MFAGQLANFLLYLSIIIIVFGYIYLPKDPLWRILVAILGALALQFKFNVGVGIPIALLLCVLFSSLSHIAKLSCLLFFALLSFCLFYVLSGGGNFFSYIKYGWEISSVYSEIYGLGQASNIKDYLLGIALCLRLLIVYFIGSFGLIPNKKERVGLLLIILQVLFFNFKNAFVRADNHALGLVYIGGELLIIGLVFFKTQRWRCQLYCIYGVLSALFISQIVANYNVLQPISVGKQIWEFKTPKEQLEQSKSIIIKTEKKLSSTYSFILNPLKETCETFKVKNGRKPSIAFYPYEQILIMPVREICDLMIMPGFQIDNFGPYTKLSMLEQKVLKDKGPDLIIISNNSVDGRNSITDYGDILDILFTKYSPIHDVGEYMILERKAKYETLEQNIVCSQSPSDGWNFVRLKYDPSFIEKTAYKISMFAFKPPVYAIDTTFPNGKLTSRVYLTQLQKGIFIAPRGVLGAIRDNIVNVILLDQPVIADLLTEKWWNRIFQRSKNQVSISYCKLKQ